MNDKTYAERENFNRVKVIVSPVGRQGPRGPEGQGDIDPNSFKGSDVSRIQQGLSSAIDSGKTLRITPNKSREDGVWLLDEAILLDSNTNILIDATLKLSDNSRDNVFRTRNVGLGISNPWSNYLENVRIEGTDRCLIEGADVPRSTGDSGKTLSMDYPSVYTDYSYGSDAGVNGEVQTGDWRNIAIIIGCTKGVTVKNIKTKNTHAYAISIEYCEDVIVNGFGLDSPHLRDIGGETFWIKNLDGVNLRQGAVNATIDDVYGISGDDLVALNTNGGGYPAGEFGRMNVTGATQHEEANMVGINISRVKGRTRFNIVRVLASSGNKISTVRVDDIADLPLSDIITSRILVFGSAGRYGEDDLRAISNVFATNIVCNFAEGCVAAEGGLSNAQFSNISKISDSTRDWLYVNPDGSGVENITATNITVL